MQSRLQIWYSGYLALCIDHEGGDVSMEEAVDKSGQTGSMTRE